MAGKLKCSFLIDRFKKHVKFGFKQPNLSYTLCVKHLFLAAFSLLLPAATVTLQAQPILTTQEIKNVNGTSDVTVNATLPLAPPTFNLSGPITGNAAFFFSVTAQTTDGLSSYSGSVDPFTNNYLVKVPAGTYQLSVSYIASLSSASGLSTYNDPASVQVVADTVHAIAVIPTALRNLSGTITGLDPRLKSTNLIFFSTDPNASSSFSIGKLLPDGTYTASLPDGIYSAVLLLATKDSSQITSLTLGAVTMAGVDMVANFTAPALSNLSGTVQRSDGFPILTGSSVFGLEGSLASLIKNANAFPISSFAIGSIDPPSRFYQMFLPTGRQYTLLVSLNIFLEQLPQSSGSLSLLLPNTVQLPGDVTQNIGIPLLPASVTISGVVTGPSGTPLVNATVAVTSAEVSGIPPIAVFSRSTQTDATGSYRLTVLSGTNYDLLFTPPDQNAGNGFAVNGFGNADRIRNLRSNLIFSEMQIRSARVVEGK